MFTSICIEYWKKHLLLTPLIVVKISKDSPVVKRQNLQHTCFNGMLVNLVNSISWNAALMYMYSFISPQNMNFLEGKNCAQSNDSFKTVTPRLTE